MAPAVKVVARVIGPVKVIGPERVTSDVKEIGPRKVTSPVTVVDLRDKVAREGDQPRESSERE